MSIIRPSLRPRRGRILIGLLAVTTTAVAIVPIAQARTRHDLVFKVSGSSHQNVIGTHGVVISVHCPAEACTVVASAASTSSSVHTGKVRAKVSAGGTKRITLPLDTRDGAKLKAALEAGKAPTLTVHATAHDAFGGKVPLTLTVKPNKL